MPTGACGINCDVCKLRLLEICSTCGPGKSIEAQRKLEAQRRILGDACPVLACAALNHLDYCLRDCNAFPCGNFRYGPYPFSRGFISMQERRRQERPPALTHNLTRLEVPAEYWETLKRKDLKSLSSITLSSPHTSGGLLFRFLQEDILVDVRDSCIKRFESNEWKTTDDPLLELVVLLYFNGLDKFHPVGKDIVGPKDLKEAHYFKGLHDLPLTPLLERYGNDLEGFRKAAENIGGTSLDMADAAYVFYPFPRVPLYYLLWTGDEEFPPRLSVLFDRSVEQLFSASAIWALVKLVSTALLQGPATKL